MLFQSTLPRGERHFCYRLVHFRDYFNPRSREGSDPCSAAKGSESAYFNPRSREGSDGMLAQIKGTAKVISIHAPARGATGQSDSVRAVVRISIHAPARGATRRNGRGLPEETISIHAPARGATTDGILLSSSNLFQSTLPRGERLSQLTYQRGGFRFQSTLPRGERQFRFRSLAYTSGISIHAPARGATAQLTNRYIVDSDFNPRSREGSDGTQKRNG